MYERLDNRPVPPKWVQDLNIVPARYRTSTLAAENKEEYSPAIHAACVDFIKNWPAYRITGKNLLLLSGSNDELLRAGSAVLNELYMRFRSQSDITSSWLSVRTAIPSLFEHRKKGDDTYMHLRDNIHNCTVLWVHNPTDIQYYQEGFWFLNSLYGHRLDSGKSFITTIRVLDVVKGYKEVSEVLPKHFVKDLIDNAIIAKGVPSV